MNFIDVDKTLSCINLAVKRQNAVPCIAPVQIAVQTLKIGRLSVQYHTTDIAKACNVTLNTVRNWCKDYSAFLSPGAAVTSGQREFTGHDLEVFKYIALLRAEGAKRDAIIQRLGETTFPEIDTSGQEDTTLTIVDAPDAHQGTPANLMTVDAILDIQRQVDALKQSVSEGKQSQRDAIYYMAVGFVAALLFVILLLLLFLVRGYL